MMIIFIAALMGVFSLQFFYLNWTIQGLNRSIISTPIELFYQDIIPSGGEAKFTVKEIEEHLDEYYQKSLSKYVQEYEVNYYFYNKIDESICVEDYCDALEVSVDAKLLVTYNYHRVMYYELRRN